MSAGARGAEDSTEQRGGRPHGTPAERLFSYGTLRQPEVQRATFGRELGGREDAIVGFRVEDLLITDPHVIETSGSDRHPVVVPAEDPSACVEGTVFTLTADELRAADAYEVDDYARTEVPLRSGGTAWAYVHGQASRD